MESNEVRDESEQGASVIDPFDTSSVGSRLQIDSRQTVWLPINEPAVGPSPWTAWWLRTVAVLAMLLATSLAFIWIEQNYFGEATNSVLSFRSPDQPAMPYGMTAVPVIGTHYFGDFQRPLGWALNIRQNVSPYNLSGANYPPLSLLFLVPFTLFHFNIATDLFLGLTAVLFLVPLWLLMSPLAITYRMISIAVVGVITTPFIAIMDRGNIAGVTIGLCAIALVLWRSKRWFWCGAVLAVAIAFKGYPAGLLIIPLALRRYRFTLEVLAGAIAMSFAALAVIPAGIAGNWSWFKTLVLFQTQTSDGDQLNHQGLYALIPKMGYVIFGPNHISAVMNPSFAVSWIPSIVFLFFLYVVIRRQRVPQWCWGPLSLASIQLIGGFGGGIYTLGWACIAAVWFGWGSLIDPGVPPGASTRCTPRMEASLRVLTLLSIVSTLVPNVVIIPGAGGSQMPLSGLLGPVFLSFTICVAFVASVLPVRYEATGTDALSSSTDYLSTSPAKA